MDGFAFQFSAQSLFVPLHQIEVEYLISSSFSALIMTHFLLPSAIFKFMKCQKVNTELISYHLKHHTHTCSPPHSERKKNPFCSLIRLQHVVKRQFCSALNYKFCTQHDMKPCQVICLQPQRRSNHFERGDMSFLSVPVKDQSRLCENTYESENIFDWMRSMENISQI